MDYEWDPAKARANANKHGVEFVDAVTALDDELAITIGDPDATEEERFVSMGADASGRILVTVFTLREGLVRIISSRKASKAERRAYAGVK
jgi:uncharacterized protein